MKRYLFILATIVFSFCAKAEDKVKSLYQLQKEFVELKFGMFIHFSTGTFMEEDWSDPEAPVSIFNPTKLDCNKWAEAAKTAKMRYGCLTTKHHNGFCLWNTKTTDYNAMNAPVHRDVVREYADAFRAAGLKVCLYYSILDTHHKLRPGCITDAHVEMVKKQLTELLTNYGDITALIIDGWDASWSRISYDDIPFEDIYLLVKKLQPNCLVMDLNSGKYPAEALFYSDIKAYEQNAGQYISKESNTLPALSCLPINKMWFWKTSYPTEPVKDAETIVNENINPMNRIFCNFILNVPPNRDGLFDDNALTLLRRIGELWDDNAVKIPPLPECAPPVISSNIAKNQTCNSSWSNDMWIMDFANDDNFRSAWHSNPQVKSPWYEIVFKHSKQFNTITIVDSHKSFDDYELLYEKAGEWFKLDIKPVNSVVKTHRFNAVWGNKVKIIIKQSSELPSINEFCIFNEIR